MKFLWIGVFFFFPFHSWGQHQVTVFISNLKGSEGQVVAALFNGKGDFLKKDYRHEIVPVGKLSQVKVVFKDIPEGRYAISVIHDENRNEKLDTNFMGIPKESFGFSKNAKGTFGPPSFEAASFSVSGADRVMYIKLSRLL